MGRIAKSIRGAGGGARGKLLSTLPCNLDLANTKMSNSCVILSQTCRSSSIANLIACYELGSRVAKKHNSYKAGNRAEYTRYKELRENAELLQEKVDRIIDEEPILHSCKVNGTNVGAGK